jgi:porin
VGWAPGTRQETREGLFGDGDYHVTVWHVDNREKVNIPDDWGFTLAGEQEIGGLLLFLRYGTSDDQASPIEHMVSGGVVFEDVFGAAEDAIGLGLAWSKVADFEPLVFTDIAGQTFKIDSVANENQYTAELFYRAQLTPRLTVTPSVQLVVDPAANNDKDAIGVFGIRGRLAF